MAMNYKSEAYLEECIKKGIIINVDPEGQPRPPKGSLLIQRKAGVCKLRLQRKS